MSRCCCGNIPRCHLDRIISFFSHYMAFITVTGIRHRHLSTDDIHQINRSIKPFVADKKKKSASVQFDYQEDTNDLWLKETGLGFLLLSFFFSSLHEMKPSALMMLAGMRTMLMWESVMRRHTTALAPGLPVKRDLNIQKWHRGLSHVKSETLAISRRAEWPWIEAEGYNADLCLHWCHSHTRKKTHSLHQSGRWRTCSQHVV